jgi:rubrerythrin
MAENEKLIQLIKTQIEIENEHVRKLGDLEKKIDTAAARLLLYEMRLDSQKHAGILTEILLTLKGVPPNKTLWDYRIDSYVDQLAIARALENHVKMETDVLNHVQEEIEHTKDAGLKLLLQHIAADEEKHHEILNEVIKHSSRIGP